MSRSLHAAATMSWLPIDASAVLVTVPVCGPTRSRTGLPIAARPYGAAGDSIVPTGRVRSARRAWSDDCEANRLDVQMAQSARFAEYFPNVQY